MHFQDCWLLQQNIKISTGFHIWVSVFSECVILKWDLHQGIDAKHFHFMGASVCLQYVCWHVWLCVHKSNAFLEPCSHQHWSKWDPWALFEIHNEDEALHIIWIVKAAFKLCTSILSSVCIFWAAMMESGKTFLIATRRMKIHLLSRWYFMRCKNGSRCVCALLVLYCYLFIILV